MVLIKTPVTIAGVFSYNKYKPIKTSAMNRFYFNTGVNTITVINFPFEYHKKVGNVTSSNGVLLCQFDCEAPVDATLMYLCDNPNLDVAKSDGVGVFKIFNTSMVSK